MFGVLAYRTISFLELQGNPGKQEPEDDAEDDENRKEPPRVFPCEFDDREPDVGPSRSARRVHPLRHRQADSPSCDELRPTPVDSWCSHGRSAGLDPMKSTKAPPAWPRAPRAPRGTPPGSARPDRGPRRASSRPRVMNPPGRCPRVLSVRSYRPGCSRSGASYERSAGSMAASGPRPRPCPEPPDPLVPSQALPPSGPSMFGLPMFKRPPPFPALCDAPSFVSPSPVSNAARASVRRRPASSPDVSAPGRCGPTVLEAEERMSFPPHAAPRPRATPPTSTAGGVEEESAPLAARGRRPVLRIRGG